MGGVTQQIYVNAHDGKIYRLKKTGWKECGSNRKGYLQFSLHGKTVRNHRYIYEHVFGPIPDGYEINHKNHQRHDNRIDNMELVTRSQNTQFIQKRGDNKSGIPNISWHVQRSKYVIRFQVDNKDKHFGYFKELNNETIDIRNEIARKLNIEFNCYFPIVDYFGEIIY